MTTHRIALLSLLFATAAAAAQRPTNFDAVAAAPRAVQSQARAMAARAGGGGVRAEWNEQLDLPTFVWFGESSGAATREPAEAAARQQLFAHASLYGLGFSDAAGAYVANVHDLGRGPIVVKFRQRIDGIDVFRDELNVVLTREHALVAMSGYLAPAASSAAMRAQGMSASASAWPLDESQAVDAAMRDLVPVPDGGLLPRTPRVNRVWFHLPDRLEPAYHIELDVADRDSTDSLMVAYVIAATDGRVLYRKDLTEDVGTTFTYRVWADPNGIHRPLNGPQGFGGSPNPTGTLDGFQAPFIAPILMTLSSIPFSKNDPWLAANATETVGNNADAYVDLVAPDGYTAGRDFRAPMNTNTGTFDFTYDVTQQPDAAQSQRYAAITQLFYTVNYLHDLFYDAGFNEAAGNAQLTNFGRGGVENDSMRAEAQDYSGRNNANMSTPADGGRPRMQMYIFDGIAGRSMDVDTSSATGQYATGTADFGPQSFDVTAAVVAASPADACSAIAGATGKIVFADRGTCGFQVKAQNAKNAGAAGLIVGNVDTSANPSSLLRMACSASPCDAAAPGVAPSMFVVLADATRFRTALAAGGVHARLRRDTAIDRDGALDNEVVAHEWCHYLSNRLIGNSVGLTSVQSRGMGEGWSDFNSLLLAVRPEDTAVPSNANWNGAYPAASYVTGGGSNGPILNGGFYWGIRRVPYSTDMTKDPLSLRHIGNGVAISGAPMAFGTDGGNNAEVHNTGEVWTTMLWECYAALLRDTLGSSPRLTFAEAQKRMREYLVASLKITPVDPTFLDSRNALLAAAFARDAVDFQEFWQAFAKRGAGVLAMAGDRYSNANAGMVEDFHAGNAVAFVSAALDDSVSGCNHNGTLDGGESGLLTITARNSGNGRLDATTARVTSSDPRLTFDNGGVVTLPGSDPGQVVTATLKATLAATTDVVLPAITIAMTDPQLAVQAPVISTFSPRLNAHDEPKMAASDDVESVRSAWTVTSQPVGTTPAFSTWSRFELAPAQHVWKSIEPLRQADSSLVSPPLVVGPEGILVITFRHRYSFDAAVDSTGAPVYLDGGVVEISTDDGNSWTDAGRVTTPGYATVAIFTGVGNPLEGRFAFAGSSPGFTPAAPSSSPFVTATTGFSGLANKAVRFRFRAGLGAAHAIFGFGWQVDDVAVTGLANLPFYGLVGDRGLCGLIDSTTTLKATGSTIEATVAAASGTPYGSVEFTENGVVVAASALANGKASFDSSRLTPGAHVIVASFNGSTNFNPSQSAALNITAVAKPRHRGVRH
jgi:hypothetical protein